MSASFKPKALHETFGFLDECPPSLLENALMLPSGSLEQNVNGVVSWRTSLLRGEMPESLSWLPPAIATRLTKEVQALGILEYLEDDEGLVDEFMSDLLFVCLSESAMELYSLQALPGEFANAQVGAEGSGVHQSASRAASRLNVASNAFAEEAAKRFRAWSERVHLWNQVSTIFGPLGRALGRGFDLSRGVLRHIGWQQIEALRKIIKHSPEITEIVEALGRVQESGLGEQLFQSVTETVQTTSTETQKVQVPRLPGEVIDIEKSGDIARMLPNESALLLRKSTKMLWHARRAENGLLTYLMANHEYETVETSESVSKASTKAAGFKRGPIIAVIDTSGSMHGLPERIAKAIVLESVRVATRENRPCKLFAFSGPNQARELTLEANEEGLKNLLTFLSESFGGGTDLDNLNLAIDRTRAEDWKNADIFLVTDGQWTASHSLIQRVKETKESGVRFHGMLVGNPSYNGIETICDPVHRFKDWADVRAKARW